MCSEKKKNCMQSDVAGDVSYKEDIDPLLPLDNGTRRQIKSNKTIKYHELTPIMRIEDRLFDRGWVRSAMATRKCGNNYFPKYFMAVRPFLTRKCFQELFGLEG